MNTLATALLGMAAAIPTAHSRTAEFQVELFSGRVVEAVTLEAGKPGAKLCGLKLGGPCVALDAGQRAVCRADRLVRCRGDKGGWSFTSLAISSPNSFRLMPSFASVEAAPKAFLATKARIRAVSKSLKVITQVDLESYVAGVVAGEGSLEDPPATRGALAIVARTWALRWQGRHRADGYDFCSLTHCQVYRPPRAGIVKSLDVAAGTRGQVLRYHGALADPYFSACCGGTTEAAGNVWPHSGRPYLVSLRDPYCMASRHGIWQSEISTASIEQVLHGVMQIPLAAPLRQLAIEERDSSGRATVLRVSADATWNVDANAFRYATNRRLGWGQIKSNLYTIAQRGDAWVFSGHGFGHGVGLCQAGAEQMGRLGFSAERILRTYFPGTEIATLPRGDTDPVASSEHFELAYPGSEDPWVARALGTLEQWRRQLGARTEILPPRVHVQTWSTSEDFIHATGERGWMAGASDGRTIALQPLSLLARRKILGQTLRHELTHLVVDRVRARAVPRWYEEGFVLYLTGERIAPPKMPGAPGRTLDRAIANPRSEAEMKAAYAQALERVRQLARRHGEPALWRALAHPTTESLAWFQDED